MSKYVFKNAEVEKALRLVAKELGVSDEEFDSQIKQWFGCTSIYLSDGDRDVLTFSTKLIKLVKDYNPSGWNDSDVIPPEDPKEKGTSQIMLVENYGGHPTKSYYDLVDKKWCEIGTDLEIECARYRLYPSD